MKTPFQSAGGGVRFHLLSHQRCAAVSKTEQRKGMNSQRVRRAGNNSAASEGVAAVSVREMEKGECVWERGCLCESEFQCTVASVAELCRRMASCVFPSACRALWWGRALQGGERCRFTRITSISENQHLAGVSQCTMVGRGTPCWHQRDWLWQPTRGLPGAPVAPPWKETEPCESDLAACNSWTCFPGQTLDFSLCLNLFFYFWCSLDAPNSPVRRGIKADGTRGVSKYWLLTFRYVFIKYLFITELRGLYGIMFSSFYVYSRICYSMCRKFLSSKWMFNFSKSLHFFSVK